MNTVYCGRCRECGAVVRETDDPDERDWLLVWHRQRSGHVRFRRWTQDRLGDISARS